MWLGGLGEWNSRWVKLNCMSWVSQTISLCILWLRPCAFCKNSMVYTGYLKKRNFANLDFIYWILGTRLVRIRHWNHNKLRISDMQTLVMFKWFYILPRLSWLWLWLSPIIILSSWMRQFPVCWIFHNWEDANTYSVECGMWSHDLQQSSRMRGWHIGGVRQWCHLSSYWSGIYLIRHAWSSGDVLELDDVF